MHISLKTHDQQNISHSYVLNVRIRRIPVGSAVPNMDISMRIAWQVVLRG